ncbi:MAG: adenylate/guanylate cyclase domain-containing protein, partial [Deltaproteobacteria bacterium]|nr:adenylate/guanylate cyclase domain-containing protein [Deltaproteobacteria bacterium]
MEEDTGSPAHVETRKLAAIMFTDIVGFSRQMGANETRMLRVLEAHNQIIQQAVAAHHGHVIKTIGDAFLVDFPSVVNTVQCAQRIRDQFRAYNTEKEQAEQIHVRIGIHSGDIVQREGDVFGDGVNVASRLQTLAEPDTICISHVVYQEVEKKLSLGTVVSLGRPRLKNIAQRQPVYALLSEKPKGFRQTLRVQRLKLKQWQRTLQVAAILLLVGAGALIGRSFYFPSPAGLPLPDKPSIAVLPFTNMSGNPEQEYFSDGMTETLITDLSKISSLFVISRNSVFTYKGKAVKPEQVSRELGVQYVVEGSVQKAQDRVRINAQLVDATTGGHLWAERYDRELADIFALQDEVIQKIVTALAVKLTAGEQVHLRRFPTDNLEAYDHFLRGIEYYHRFRKEANVQARQMFMRALELDPQYAAAYALLSWTHWTDWYSQWDPASRPLERAFETAQRAVTLNDSLAEAHMILGIVYLWQKQHEQALTEAERAIALNPNEADAYWVLGFILNYVQRYQDALRAVEKAMRLNPYYPPYY